MKIRLAFWIAALVAGYVPAARAASFTYESASELCATLDADGDGLADLVMVDKAGGVRQLALQQADGTFVWSDPASTGIDNVTALSAGRFTFNSAREGFTVTAPFWNRVLVFPDVNGDSTHAPTTGIGPNLVVAFNFAGDSLDDLAVATQWDSPPDTTHLAGVQTSDLGMSVIYGPSAESGPLTSGNRVRFRGDRPWMLGALRPGTNGTEFITRPFFNFPGFANGPTLSGLDTNTTWVWGEFAPGANAQFLFYAPGASTIQMPGIQEPSPYVFSWTAGSTFDFGQAIAQVMVTPKTNGAMLVVVFDDGSTAGAYDFDGTNAPVARQTFTAPAGMKYSLANALGGGDFLLLHGPHGGQGNSAGWQRWSMNGSQHTLAASGVIPAITVSHARANVLLYAGNPDTSSDAPLLRLLRVGEWSDSATLTGGALQVTREHSRGGTSGLGDPAATNVTTSAVSPFGVFPVVNQRGAGESTVWLGPPATQPFSDLAFSPAPGAYPLGPGSTLEVRLTATPDAPLFYRTDAGQPWTAYDASSPPRISATTTFLAYANASAPTPIRTARYTIGDPPPLVPAAPADANRDGLPDAWQQLFGLTDPNGDADGDGFTNLQEYQAGTDPLDPLSVPASTPLTNALLVARAPGPGAPPGTLCEIAWPADVAGAVLETTLDLTAPAEWSQAPGPVVTSRNERVYYSPAVAVETRRFFRLHSQP